MENLELIKINENEKGEPTVSGRELYKFLEVTERYSNWFNRMLQYGFVENVDYLGCKIFNTQARQELQEHILKLSMAKEIAMLQRNEKGKQIRQYFIEIEKRYNDPIYQLARSLKIANKVIEDKSKEIQSLKFENKQKTIEIEKKDKKLEHKQEIIKGFTEDVSLLEKRQLLNRVVRYKGSNYKERWNELYKVFKETEHIDIKTRYESYLKIYKKGMTKVISKLDYAEKFGHLDKLYKIALKLYEEDMKELLRNFREVITMEG